jgi:hypothetical protein
MKKSRSSWSTALRPLVLGAFPQMIPLQGHAATLPPWYPGTNSVGHVVFYDASGHLVRGGALTDQFVLYSVASSADYRSGDTKATVFAYTPVQGVPQDAWTGAQITATQFGYPFVDAPAPLSTATQPISISQPGDWTLAMYTAAYPNPQTTGPYAGLYELRMKPSGPNIPTGPQYWNTVISVDTTAGTWSVYYP